MPSYNRGTAAPISATAKDLFNEPGIPGIGVGGDRLTHPGPPWSAEQTALLRAETPKRCNRQPGANGFVTN